MCCETCARYKDCRVLTTVHVHSRAHGMFPPLHYHLCRATKRTCAFDCRMCGCLVREIPRLLGSHFVLGCCHRCASYEGCDCVQRHVERLTTGSGVANSAAPVEAVARETDGTVRASGPSEAASGGSLAVLVVDDNAVFLESAVEYLARDSTLKVQGAADGHEALRAMNQLRPDVVVLDLMMQGLNGFDICRLIKKSVGEKKVHVLILSGFASKDAIDTARNCGADLCLAKPIRLGDLKNAMMTLARGAGQDGGSGHPAGLAAPRAESGDSNQSKSEHPPAPVN
jgi:CheY-like chemotaxis protein